MDKCNDCIYRFVCIGFFPGPDGKCLGYISGRDSDQKEAK